MRTRRVGCAQIITHKSQKHDLGAWPTEKHCVLSTCCCCRYPPAPTRSQHPLSAPAPAPARSSSFFGGGAPAPAAVLLRPRYRYRYHSRYHCPRHRLARRLPLARPPGDELSAPTPPPPTAKPKPHSCPAPGAAAPPCSQYTAARTASFCCHCVVSVLNTAPPAPVVAASPPLLPAASSLFNTWEGALSEGSECRLAGQLLAPVQVESLQRPQLP